MAKKIMKWQQPDSTENKKTQWKNNNIKWG